MVSATSSNCHCMKREKMVTQNLYDFYSNTWATSIDDTNEMKACANPNYEEHYVL